MKVNFLVGFLIVSAALNACAKTSISETKTPENRNVSSAIVETNAASGKTENIIDANTNANLKTFESQTKQPRTVREFFNLLPQKYFPLEGCELAKDPNCDKARNEYVKNYLETEDTANGYWKSGCDGGQSCLEMALFKRPDASYVVAVHTTFETDEMNYFLEYKNGEWSDIGAQIVPEFSDKNIYELPQKGTTVKVFKKNFPEPEFSERGARIYDLKWENGKFQKQR